MENTATLRRQIETNEPTRDELIGSLVGHYQTATSKIVDLEKQILSLQDDLSCYMQWKHELRQEALKLDFDLDTSI